MTADPRPADPAGDAAVASVAAVVHATVAGLDEALARPGVQAVVLAPPRPQPWRAEVAAAVERGELTIERVTLRGIDPDRFAAWLERHVARCLAPATRDALLSDLLALLHLAERVSGTRSSLVRVLTEAPGPRCGFHVDTVPPGAPAWGVLKVYNGEGTRWVEPAAVSVPAFYAWLQERDRLVRDHAQDARLADLVRRFDEAPAFLTGAGADAGAGDGDSHRHDVPAGATVVFRHLRADDHWGHHPAAAAWIHSSPSTGPRRLVVNTSPDRPPPARAARAARPGSRA